jgi:large subunit ribosomal protein L23
MRSPETIIKRPLLTEKGTRLKETGGHGPGHGGEGLDPASIKSQLLFEVARDANKVEIRYAVEKLWSVSVVDVRTCVVRGKEKRVGRFIGKTSHWKKAIVTLAAGQNVEFFEGV